MIIKTPTHPFGGHSLAVEKAAYDKLDRDSEKPALHGGGFQVKKKKKNLTNPCFAKHQRVRVILARPERSINQKTMEALSELAKWSLAPQR